MLECVANVSEGRVTTRWSTRSPTRAVRRCSTCTAIPTTTAACSRSPGNPHATLPRCAVWPRRCVDARSRDARRCAPSPRRARRRAVRRARRHAGAAPRSRPLASFATWWSRRTAFRASSTTMPTAAARPFRRSAATAFHVRAPDFGPPHPHPRLGATAVGARPPLVALNCVLDGGLVEVAQAIARARSRARRRPARRARARLLAREPRAPQVSMNLVDLERTGVEAGVRRGSRSWPARAAGRSRVELVGSAARRRADPVRRRVPGRGAPRRPPHDRGPDADGRAERERRRVVRPKRCRDARAPAGGAAGDAHARTCRPRSRTSRRGAARTRGTPYAPRSRCTPPSPPWWRRPAPGRTGRDRRPGSWLAPASVDLLRRATVSSISTMSRIGCSPLMNAADGITTVRYCPRCVQCARGTSNFPLSVRAPCADSPRRELTLRRRSRPHPAVRPRFSSRRSDAELMQ